MPKLVTHVHVRDADGVSQVFGPGDTIPAWAAKQITNPNAWDSVPAPNEDMSGSGAAAVDVPIPPKAGKGSGLPRWQAYAKFKGYEFDADATREDIVAALEADGVATE